MFQKLPNRLVRVAALLIMGLANFAPVHAQQTNSATQSQSVGGTNATAVSVGQSGKRTGDVRKVDAQRWIETDAAGQAIYRYDEVKRDGSSVHLLDSSRDVTLQLDVRARKATYSDKVSRRREVFDILSSSAAPVQVQASSNDSMYERKTGPLTSRERTTSTAPAPVRESAPLFCVNDSVSRGAGSMPGRGADCPAGYTNNGSTCSRAADSIAAPSRAAECPAEFNNSGATCERPAKTKPNTNTRPADCPDKYTNTGSACFALSAATPLGASSMTCKPGETKIEGRCFKGCETGFSNVGATCVRPASTLGADKMTCKSSYQKDSTGQRCIASCAAGYTSNGETCVRAAETKGLDSMSCKAGETRSGARCMASNGGCASGQVMQGGQCYAACAAGFEGVGSVCFAQAAPKAWVQCGTGSAKDAAACSAAVFDPVASARQLAVSVARMSGPAPAMQKKYKEMSDAFARIQDMPNIKQARDAWAQASSSELAMERMASARSDDEMKRYAVQVAAIVDLSGPVAAPAYPKCNTIK